MFGKANFVASSMSKKGKILTLPEWIPVATLSFMLLSAFCVSCYVPDLKYKKWSHQLAGEGQHITGLPLPHMVFSISYFTRQTGKKNEITPFVATQADLEIIILSEISHTEKDKYDITYMSKYDINEPTYLWNTNRITDREKTCGNQEGGGGWGGIDWGLGVSKCKLLYRGWINNKVFLYA